MMDSTGHTSGMYGSLYYIRCTQSSISIKTSDSPAMNSTGHTSGMYGSLYYIRCTQSSISIKTSYSSVMNSTLAGPHQVCMAVYII